MMPQTVEEKATCETCGVDVRENTLFCYNCGSKLDVVAAPASNGSAALISDGGKAALDDLAERLRQSDGEEEKLAKAASERKKARIIQRKQREFVWEPRDDTTALPLLFAIVVTVVTLLVVFLLVVWK